MNPIEEQLRQSLNDAVQRVQPHHDARRENRLRLARARTRARVAISGAAVVAATAMGVAVVFADHIETGADRPADVRTSATPRSTPHSTTPPKPPGPRHFLIRQFPPTTEVFRLDPPPGGLGDPTFCWFGIGKVDSSGRKGFGGCNLTVRGISTGGGCGPFRPLAAHEVVRPLDKRILFLRAGGTRAATMGWARDNVTAVQAILPDGTRAPGSIGRGKGFPCKVWRIAFPRSAKDAGSVVTLVFSDSAGHRSLRSR